MILPDDIVGPAISLKDQLFDLRGLSAYSSLKVPTLRLYIRRGKLPAYKVKGKILIRRSEFDAWLESFRLNNQQDLEAVVDSIMADLKR